MCLDPDMPADIKAAPTGEGSILLVWRPPLHANGILTKYTIIMKDLSDREVHAAVLIYCLPTTGGPGKATGQECVCVCVCVCACVTADNN